MDKNLMSETLYALSNNEIVKRRKPLTKPIVWSVVGALLILCDFTVLSHFNSDALHLTIVVAAGTMLVIGLTMLFRGLISGDGVPFYQVTGTYVEYEEIYFSKDLRSKVMALCKSGDAAALRALSDSNIPAIVVALYETRDKEICAMQPFEYSELEYRALDEMRLFRS